MQLYLIMGELKVFIKRKLNQDGVTFVEILISLSFLLILVFIIGQTQSFLLKSNTRAEKNALVLEVITNTIADVYHEEDWSNLKDKFIETKHGKLIINYDKYEKETPFFTESINVNFKLGNIDKNFQLERSIFGE